MDNDDYYFYYGISLHQISDGRKLATLYLYLNFFVIFM